MKPFFFYIKDKFNNHCATLSFDDDKLTINSLRFAEHQKKCDLRGAVLLTEILKLCPSVVSSVNLEDHAYKMIVYENKSYKILLTPFRKFVSCSPGSWTCSAEGWYEKFGFEPHPEDEVTKEEYDNSYEALKLARFSDLMSFLWYVVSSNILESDIDKETLHSLCSEVFEECDVPDHSLFQLKRKLKEKNLRIKILIRFFEHFGIEEDSPHTELANEFGINITEFGEKSGWDVMRPKTALALWKKTGHKSRNHDLFEYIVMMNEILRVLGCLNCLQTPTRLLYTGRTTTLSPPL
jgi:hypothetical protein